MTRSTSRNGRRVQRALGLSLVLGACAPKPAPHAPESAPGLVETAPAESSADATGSTPPTAQPEPEPGAPDTSLELPVYRAAGVPDIDHRWSVQDYRRSLEVFAQMLRSGRADLPRYASPRSGALFGHLVDERNFAAPAAAPAADRARELQRYLEVFPGLLQVYSPASDGLDFAAEQSELIVAVLELLKSALEESRQLVREDASWSPTYQAQQNVSVGVVRGLSSMLGERQRYSDEQRARLKAELVQLAPAIEQHLDAESARTVHAIASQ